MTTTNTIKAPRDALEEIAASYDGVYESQGSEIGPDLRESFAALALADASEDAPDERHKLIPMQNDEGKRGWFFDCDEFYIDIDLEEDGTHTVYFRSRKDDTHELYAPYVGPDAARPAPAAPIAEAPIYTVGSTRCTCHPETCCCSDYAIYGPDGKHSTYDCEIAAQIIADLLNAEQAKPEPVEQAPKFDEAEFDAMVERGTKVWSKVPDGWLEQQRGNEPADGLFCTCVTCALCKALNTHAAGMVDCVSDEELLRLACIHTGKRVNLTVAECFEHIDFGRAAIAASATHKEEGK